jgi:hypothetical protein
VALAPDSIEADLADDRVDPGKKGKGCRNFLSLINEIATEII